MRAVRGFEGANLIAAGAWVLVGVGFVLGSRHVFRSWFSPLAIYGGVWSFSLALYYVGIVEYFALEWRTVLVYVATLVLFTIGSLLSLLGVGPGLRSTPQMTPSHTRVRALEATILILLGAGLTGSFLYYLHFQDTIGLDMLWQNPRFARLEESVGVLRRAGWAGLARELLQPALVLSVIGMTLGAARRRWWAIAGAVLPTCALIAATGRTTLVVLAAWGFLGWVYARETRGGGAKALRPALRILGLGVVVFVAYFFVTSMLFHKEALAGLSGARGAWESAGSTGRTLVHYIAGPLPAFQEVLADPAFFEGGGSRTFGVVARVLNWFAPTRFAYPEYVEPFVGVPYYTNVYTYLDCYFVEFGWAGLLLFPLGMGFVASKVFIMMRRRPTVGRVYLASLVGLCTLEATGVNRFGTFETWLWIGVPLGLMAACRILGQAGPRAPTVATQGRAVSGADRAPVGVRSHV